MTLTVDLLSDQLGAEVRGDRRPVLRGAESLEKAGPHDISFVCNESNVRRLAGSRAGAVLIGRKDVAAVSECPGLPTLLVVDDAQAAFIQVLQQFRPQRPRLEIGVSDAAHVAPDAQIGAGTNVFPGAYIADDVVIGENCDIHPGAYVGPGCRLGDQVTLHPNVVLYADVVVGSRTVIHACAVIGADGFGYRLEQGRYVKIPQLGSVRIGEDVEIGACTTVDRGMIGPTVIGEGTKLDNLIMIGHNCELGRHNAYASQTGFAGSVTTGDYVRCAGQVGVADHLHLGDGSTLGAKAAVHKDVPAGETHLGYPARRESEQIRIVIAQSRLPEMRRMLQKLQTQVTQLTSQMEQLDLSKPAA